MGILFKATGSSRSSATTTLIRLWQVAERSDIAAACCRAAAWEQRLSARARRNTQNRGEHAPEGRVLLLLLLAEVLDTGARVTRRAASTMAAMAMPRGPKQRKQSKMKAAAKHLGALSATALGRNDAEGEA